MPHSVLFFFSPPIIFAFCAMGDTVFFGFYLWLTIRASLQHIIIIYSQFRACIHHTFLTVVFGVCFVALLVEIIFQFLIRFNRYAHFLYSSLFVLYRNALLIYRNSWMVTLYGCTMYHEQYGDLWLNSLCVWIIHF